MYFTEGHTDPPREAIESNGSNSFSRGIRTSISKKTYMYLWFSRGRGLGPLPPPPSGSAHDYSSKIVLLIQKATYNGCLWVLIYCILCYCSRNCIARYLILAIFVSAKFKLPPNVSILQYIQLGYAIHTYISSHFMVFSQNWKTTNTFGV